MALVNILSDFLKLHSHQTQALIKLLSMENRWCETIVLANGQTIDPREIKTHAELIQFVQTLGQSQWFKGHDRSRFAADESDASLKNQYFELFHCLGLVEAVRTPGISVRPHAMVVLGFSEAQVQTRTQTIIEQVRNGISPTGNTIYGLGSNRQLGTGVLETEAESIKKLQDLGRSEADFTEMEMVSLIVQEALASLKTEDPERFGQLTYCAINTLGNVNRAATDCVKTADTAESLKKALEVDAEVFQNLPKPVVIFVASSQPFVKRQCLDMAIQLGNQYSVIAIGQALSQEVFNRLPISIPICLGEVARLINIAFNAQPIAAWQQPLSETDAYELFLLQNPTVSKALPSMLIWTAKLDEFNSWCRQATNPQTRLFIQYLRAFKELMTANNAQYNVAKNEPKTLELLTQVKLLADQPHHPELQAAILNLKALIERDITKDLEAAKNTLHTALALKCRLHPQSIASLYSNYAKIFTEQRAHTPAFEYHAKAKDTLISRAGWQALSPRLGAAILCLYAIASRKESQDQQCAAALQAARDLWPESNVIANNQAIALTKLLLDTPAHLHMAESILLEQYEGAKRNHLFVTPYYRADLHIKLAGYYRFNNDVVKQNHHMEIARECLRVAHEAIDYVAENGIPKYPENYRVKGHARLEKLEGNLNYVGANVAEAVRHFTAAVALRASVQENAAKTERFRHKLPDPTQPFHYSALFSKPSENVPTTSHGDARTENAGKTLS
jgi:hypothetical protein